MTRTIPAALTGQRLAVVDVEGNGGQPPEIVEIAVLTLNQPVCRGDVSTWLVRPEHPITQLVTRKVHGISNADVADCPTWTQVADDVAGLLTDRALIAHNASLEHRVLGTHLPSWQPPMVLDTLRLAKQVWPGLPGYGLDRLIVHADLDVEDGAGQRHRADFDTWMTAGLLLVLVEESGLDWPGLVRVAGLPGFDQSAEPDEPDEQGGLW
ncbi:MAG: 3'-5' exonuclease [Pseudonocardiaceae bacterium]